MLNESDLARYLAKIGSPNERGCTEWTGRTDPDGYGLFDVRVNGRKYLYRAHKLALEIRLGREIVKGLLACHKCDNPICANGEHLYEGTMSDNMRDRADRGRQAGGHESQHTAQRKLVDDLLGKRRKQ